MSVTTAISEKLAERQASQQQEAGDFYRELVQAAADGQSIDPDQIGFASEGVGRTVDDFIADVQRIEHRRELAAKLEDADALQERVQQAQKAVDKERERLKKQEQRVEDAQRQLGSARTQVARAQRIREELIRTCTDPERVASYEKQLAVVRGIGEKRASLKERCEHLQAHVRDLKSGTTHEPSSGDRHKRLSEQLEGASKQIAALQDELSSLEAQQPAALAELQARETALAEL